MPRSVSFRRSLTFLEYAQTPSPADFSSTHNLRCVAKQLIFTLAIWFFYWKLRLHSEFNLFLADKLLHLNSNERQDLWLCAHLHHLELPNMPHVGTSNKPGEGSRDSHLLPSIFGDSPSRKSPQQMLPSQERDQLGGPVQNIAPGANGNRGAVSTSALRRGPIPPPATVGAARLRNNAWTPGFEQAMKDMEKGGRAPMLAPIGSSRPTPNTKSMGRSVSAAQQGASVLDANNYSARLDLGPIRDGIENAVEQQVADALGPIRLMANVLMDNVHALGSIRQAINHENEDLHEQNDVLSRQIDLHYRDLRQHSDTSGAQIRCLAGLIEGHGHAGLSLNAHVRALTTLAETHTQINQAAAENAKRTTVLLNHLSQVVTSLPCYIGNAVNRAVALEYQGSSALIIAAQREAFDIIFRFYSQQQAEFESREAKLESREDKLESREREVESSHETWMQEFNTVQLANRNTDVEMPTAAQQTPENPSTAKDKGMKQKGDTDNAVERKVKQEVMVANKDIKQAEGADIAQEVENTRRVGEKIKAMVKKVFKLSRGE